MAGLLQYPLYSAAALYGAVTVVRNLFYDLNIVGARKLGVPVVSIGNLTTGGTGKTPVVRYLAEMFLGYGRRVGILSRGYKRRTRGYLLVSDGNRLFVDAERGGDEPVELAESLPGAVVAVDEDRVRGGKRIVREHGVDIVLLDDGFQHRRIYRDLDIVLINASRRDHLRHVLPMGRLREPLAGIRRADIVLATKSNDQTSIRFVERLVHAYASRPVLQVDMKWKDCLEDMNGVPIPQEQVSGKTALLIAGIAEPEEFRKTAERMNITVGDALWFSDHRRYTESDIRYVLEKAESSGADYIVTTGKDAVRLRRYATQITGSYPLYILRIVCVVSGDDRNVLTRYINQLMKKT
jgi:tetraacyldisaccharide 4'-kinase